MRLFSKPLWGLSWGPFGGPSGALVGPKRARKWALGGSLGPPGANLGQVGPSWLDLGPLGSPKWPPGGPRGGPTRPANGPPKGVDMAKDEGQRNPEKHQTKNINHRQINCALVCLVGLLLRLSDHISLRLSGSKGLGGMREAKTICNSNNT